MIPNIWRAAVVGHAVEYLLAAPTVERRGGAADARGGEQIWRLAQANAMHLAESVDYIGAVACTQDLFTGHLQHPIDRT